MSVFFSKRKCCDLEIKGVYLIIGTQCNALEGKKSAILFDMTGESLDT